jgi:hypothetical protein
MTQSALCRAMTGTKCNVNYFTIRLLPHGWNQIITVTNVCILYNLLKINTNNKSKKKLAVFHKLVVAKTIRQVFNSPVHSGA